MTVRERLMAAEPPSSTTLVRAAAAAGCVPPSMRTRRPARGRPVVVAGVGRRGVGTAATGVEGAAAGTGTAVEAGAATAFPGTAAAPPDTDGTPPDAPAPSAAPRCGVPARTSPSSRRNVCSSITGTPSAAARRAFAEPEPASLVTSALVWRLTEDIMFSPAATDRATSSAREVAVSPVMAIFMPCTSGPPASARPGLRYAHGVLGG